MAWRFRPNPECAVFYLRSATLLERDRGTTGRPDYGTQTRQENQESWCRKGRLVARRPKKAKTTLEASPPPSHGGRVRLFVSWPARKRSGRHVEPFFRSWRWSWGTVWRTRFFVIGLLLIPMNARMSSAIPTGFIVTALLLFLMVLGGLFWIVGVVER